MGCPRSARAAWRIAKVTVLVFSLLIDPSYQQETTDYTRDGDPPRIAARNLYEYRHLQRASRITTYSSQMRSYNMYARSDHQMGGPSGGLSCHRAQSLVACSVLSPGLRPNWHHAAMSASSGI